MNGSFLTVVGNATAEPELRFTPGGDPVCDIRLASNRKWKSGDDWEEETTFYKATVWGQMAENCADSIAKGTNIMVIGQLEVEEWETDDGETRFNLKIRAEDVAVSLRWQTAEVERVKKKDDERGGRRRSGKGKSSGRKSRERKTRDYAPDEEPF